jgi:type I restriction enzyme, S subunit
VKNDIRQISYSSGGQPNLRLEIINPFPLALPPFAEQQEIVRRVDELFALTDQVQARYAKAKEHVDNLKQSILAKAFRGELVPQDPNDEPATALLERISQDRSTQQSNHSGRRQKRSQGSLF